MRQSGVGVRGWGEGGGGQNKMGMPWDINYMSLLYMHKNAIPIRPAAACMGM